MKRAPASKGKNQQGAADVTAYLKSLPAGARAGLQKLRKTIKATLPGAKEGFSYGIPTFRLHGRPVVWYTAAKNHSSFFPGAAAIRIHAAELKGYKTSKGTVRFPPDSPPSARLVAKLVKVRLAELRDVPPS